MVKEYIGKVVIGENLTEEESYDALNKIMSGEASDAQIAAFITALRMKGETSEEIIGAARVMREKATKIHCVDEIVLDTCGTGGDEAGTFNISTIAALIATGAGATVAKHGNRAVSSKCGSMDVLKQLGVKIDISPAEVEKCVNEIGIGFLFAPVYHSAMKYAIGPRREVGIRTIFNIVGPLTNPAGAKHQLLGVFSDEYLETIANALDSLGSRHALIVCSSDGLDEITTTSVTNAFELKDEKIKDLIIDPEHFGFKPAKLEDLLGDTPEENAQTIIDILDGKEGPKTDVALLNAGAAIYVADKANSIEEGIELAKKAIKTGKAKEKLADLIKFTNQFEQF